MSAPATPSLPAADRCPCGAVRRRATSSPEVGACDCGMRRRGPGAGEALAYAGRVDAAPALRLATGAFVNEQPPRLRFAGPTLRLTEGELMATIGTAPGA